MESIISGGEVSHEKTSTYRVSTYKICIVAFAICINLVGGQIALFLKLPIYLDSIGTVFIASTLGPIYGMLPNVISGLFMGMTVDVYSLYYAPVGIILGLVTGLVYQKYKPKKWWIFVAALVITLPSTIVSSCITAFNYLAGLHHQVLTVLVQLLAKTPMGMVGACFVVQFFTDYIDRVICLFVVSALTKALPRNMMERL